MFYYAWHLMGLFWTENYSFGWFDILVKLPLGILPIVLLLHQDKIIEVRPRYMKFPSLDE